MSTTRFVAAGVVAALLIGGIPGIAQADEAPVGLRASIDRAVAQLNRQPAPKAAAKRPAQRSTAEAMQPGYGGGGGKGMMIVSIVTTVVGLVATYYVIKQVQEQSKQTGQE
jgi:hypothetical protein